MKKRVLFLVAAMTALATGCNRLDIPGMIVNHSDTEERVADWLDYNAQYGEPVIENAPDNYKFFSCSDVHYSERDSISLQGDNDRVYQFMTRERNNAEALFAVIAGDLANESGEAPYIMLENSLAYNAETQAKDDPCFCILGNHDVYFDCSDWYKKHFHTSTYSLVVKTVEGHQDLFVFLDSGNGTHGKRQLQWLKEKLSHREDYRHCIVFSHNWMFRTSYNYTTTPAANLPLDEQYDFMNLMSESDVSLVIMGHFHACEQRQFNGITYVMTDNLNEGTLDPTYLVVDCGENIQFAYEKLFTD